MIAKENLMPRYKKMGTFWVKFFVIIKVVPHKIVVRIKRKLAGILFFELKLLISSIKQPYLIDYF